MFDGELCHINMTIKCGLKKQCVSVEQPGFVDIGGSGRKKKSGGLYIARLTCHMNRKRARWGKAEGWIGLVGRVVQKHFN